MHGVGVSVVNALAEWLEVEVNRDGKTYTNKYHRGEPEKLVGTFTPNTAGKKGNHYSV